MLELLALGWLLGGAATTVSRPDIILPGGETSYPPPLDKETPDEREERRKQYLAQDQAFEEMRAQKLAALRKR